jgi:hypothetical protein
MILNTTSHVLFNNQSRSINTFKKEKKQSSGMQENAFISEKTWNWEMINLFEFDQAVL